MKVDLLAAFRARSRSRGIGAQKLADTPSQGAQEQHDDDYDPKRHGAKDAREGCAALCQDRRGRGRVRHSPGFLLAAALRKSLHTLRYNCLMNVLCEAVDGKMLRSTGVWADVAPKAEAQG